jgi:hypothetical protein
MKHKVPHDLPIDLARKAADRALEAYSAQFADYHPQVTWADDTTAHIEFNAKGITLTGVFEIFPDAVAIDMDVPLLLRPFRNKAMQVIDDQIRQWIGKAKGGTLT